MKKFISILLVMLMSISLTAFAGTKTSTTGNSSDKVLSLIPANIIVKQTIVFMDGRCLELFYQKEGNTCKLYSKTDVTKFSQDDLNRVKSTNFERVKSVAGKCYFTTNTSNLLNMLRSAIGSR